MCSKEIQREIQQPHTDDKPAGSHCIQSRHSYSSETPRKTTTCLCCITKVCDSAETSRELTSFELNLQTLDVSRSEVTGWRHKQTYASLCSNISSSVWLFYDQILFHYAFKCFINRWPERHTFNVVNMSKECTGHPLMSDNVVNKDTPEENNRLLSLMLLFQLCLLDSLCDVGWERSWYQLIISAGTISFCSLRKTHMFVLVSPQICSHQKVSLEGWEHLVGWGQRNQMAPVEFSLLTCCQREELPNTWI